MMSIKKRLRHRFQREYRLATSRLRSLPDFIIVGAQKSGTTSLYKYLLSHPNIIGIHHQRPDGKTTWGKEVHYFGSNFDRPEWWYRFHFPLKSTLSRENAITGEASPEYLYHPHAAERIASLIPGVKIIILLRDPVDRAISSYWHQVRKGVENLSIEEAFRKETERIRSDKLKMKYNSLYFGHNHKHLSYLDKGIYVTQVEKYFQHFDRNQILIIPSRDLFDDTQHVYNCVLHFIGLEPHELTNPKAIHSGSYKDTDPKIRMNLEEFFHPHNQLLFDLLEVDTPWWQY